MYGLLKRIKNVTGMSRAAHMPADNAAGVGVDDEGDISKPLPGCDISKVGDPKPVRCLNLELAVDLVERALRLFIRHGCFMQLAKDDSLQAHCREI